MRLLLSPVRYQLTCRGCVGMGATGRDEGEGQSRFGVVVP